MTRPLPTGKQAVQLAPDAARVSRIRRDPPPPVKQKLVVEPDERDERIVVVGVVTFALTLFVLVLAFGHYSGWSPKEYTVEVRASE